MPSPTTLELLWGTPDRPRRGPKPSLTLERIVGEAIELADAEGLANLSMARLAERVGCAKMALYRYIPGRTELTALMLDSALREPPTIEAIQADSPEPWRAYLRPWTEAFYERVRAHPWAHEVATGIRPMGPNELAWVDAALTVLADTGLSVSEQFDTVVLLLSHARAIALQTVASPGDDPAEEQLARELGEVLSAQAERFPHAIAAFAASMGGKPDDTEGSALTFGIDRILDGLGTLIAARRESA
ncbi:TetR/AcrR family transcriptional regulator [Nocardia sp. CDC160]|uniref:TetR/AcrR family transcriptional regulator n=1 Tax=Nocardia sp. CDC160 TaxID=3112166 RepID=UPI002DBB0E7A|nr:TetR/AcrR family transcriptional regulator C-terminal domain-containing protein [Nocardia sp. CDC160]MEC3916764.1 TetR/AcrR family transcriptional regulator C-terminal domain-containing protein [Nocardia sp. CDC160]